MKRFFKIPLHACASFVYNSTQYSTSCLKPPSNHNSICLYSSALTPKMAMSLKIEKGKTGVAKAENEIIANRPHLTIFEDIIAEKVRYFQYAPFYS
jgi:hypothetical protein